MFLKGCPLNCLWCANPESIKPDPEFMIIDFKCVGCGKCFEVCPQGAISTKHNIKKGAADFNLRNYKYKYRAINREKCNYCLKCADVCPTGAISRIGKYMDIDEVLNEVLSDELFYKNSNGGVTLSGGEPLNQYDFILELLKRCKEEELHTALDTSGFTKWDILREILNYVDLVLYDIKHIDSEKHKEWTGVDNDLIIENAAKTASIKNTWIRVPVIPGYNDSHNNLEKTIEFAKNINSEKISFLPYHEWGKHKYEKLGIKYELNNTKSLSFDDVKGLIKNINNSGLEISIGR